MATFGDVLKFASGLNGVSVRSHLTAIQSVPAIMSSADVQHIANAVAAHVTVTTMASILRNKTVTDPVTGIMTVYADDGVTPYLTAQLHEDTAQTQTYRGQGAEVRGRLQ